MSVTPFVTCLHTAFIYRYNHPAGYDPHKTNPTIQQAIGDCPTARPFLKCLVSLSWCVSVAGPSESFKEAIVGGMRLSSSCLCPVSRSHSWNLTSTSSWNCRFCSLENMNEKSVTTEKQTKQKKEVNYRAGKRRDVGEMSVKML